MKPMKTTLALALILFGTMVSGTALAHGHGHGPRVRFGVFVGAPLFWPWYYPAPYYYYPPYPPVVTVPSAPTTYIEQGSGEPAAQSQGYWYYCADANAYYPYVKQCPGGWQRVVPQPPPG